MKTIHELVDRLPPELLKQVENFIESLIDQYNGKNRCKTGKLKQNWAGGLKEYKGKYTAMELQKKALEWRAD